MELDIQRFSLAAAGTAGILFLVCAAFVALWPALALQLAAWLIHLTNVEKYVSDIGVNWTGLFFGLIQAVVYTYIGALLFAWLHNRFLKTSRPA